MASYNSVTCTSSETERLNPGRFISMRLRPKYPQLAKVVFLDKVGETLRQATSDIVQKELPEDIRLLLRRLERLEQKRLSRTPTTSRRLDRESAHIRKSGATATPDIHNAYHGEHCSRRMCSAERRNVVRAPTGSTWATRACLKRMAQEGSFRTIAFVLSAERRPAERAFSVTVGKSRRANSSGVLQAPVPPCCRVGRQWRAGFPRRTRLRRR